MSGIYDREFEEAIQYMDASCSREDLIAWLRHVEKNPYPHGDISRRIIQALKKRIS